MTVKKQVRTLGRGLSELLGNEEDAVVDSEENIVNFDINILKPGQYQPRTLFDAEKLNALAESIRKKGVLQPILVRKINGQHEIIAGERRWRAAKEAGLTHIPGLLRKMEDSEALESGLIENIQRDDLTPIEEAKAYKRLISEFGYTQNDLSEKIGKSRSHIANTLRLLNLPELIQQYVSEGKLSAGHARTLIGHQNSLDVAEQAIKQNLNVRQLERLMHAQTRDKRNSTHPNQQYNPDKESVERQLTQLLGLETHLKFNSASEGKIEIIFKSLENLDELIQTLMKVRGYSV